MKRIVSNIVFLVIVVLACFFVYKGVLERFTIQDEKIDYKSYETLYYYNQLTQEQKELYVKLDIGVNSLATKINLGFLKVKGLKPNIERALSALYNDRPEYYFLPNQYNVRIIKLIEKGFAYVEFDYNVKDVKERAKKDKELASVISKILYESITKDMTDIEKEIAIHDALVKHVAYYKYESIENIPHEKHTAYAALVEQEAVCDGISKAMMLLLEAAGIESILAFGEINTTPHAWNIVKLDGEYYQLDVTSDAIEIDSKKYVAHNYFNVTDEELLITHEISDAFKLPNCVSTKYNYYKYRDYEVLYTESMRSKMAKIINKQLGNDLLEVRIDKLYSTQNLLETLYFLDFNEWHTEGKTSIKYHNINNIYMFKNETKSIVTY